MKITIFISLIITMLLSALFALSSVNNDSKAKKNTNTGTVMNLIGVKPKRDSSERLVPLVIFTLSLTGVLLVYFFGGN